MARSRRAPAPPSGSPPPGVGTAPTPSLASAILPRVWQGLGYRLLPDAAAARTLFDFAAVPWPAQDRIAFAWGVFTGGDRLVGALAAESAERAVMFHGPVVVTEDDPLEAAAQLVAAALDHATALGVDTVFTRPLGLDRVWVRFGFIPVPESTLPSVLAGRPGAGLYAWRGGTALWTLRESPRS